MTKSDKIFTFCSSCFVGLAILITLAITNNNDIKDLQNQVKELIILVKSDSSKISQNSIKVNLYIDSVNANKEAIARTQNGVRAIYEQLTTSIIGYNPNYTDPQTIDDLLIINGRVNYNGKIISVKNYEKRKETEKAVDGM